MFGGSEEEVRAHIDRVNMSMDDRRHRLEAVWRGLSDDDCEALGNFFYSMAHADDSILRAELGLCAGRLLQIRAIRLDRCLLDDKFHDLRDMDEEQNTPEQQPEYPEGFAPVPENGAEQNAREQYAANMKLYRLEVTAENGARITRCVDCGMPYASLADRMLKEPDECPGCFHKAKFGG